MAPPTRLANLAFLLQSGQHPVEVVLLDAHLRGQLGGPDSLLSLNEGECLRGACAGAFAPAGAASGGGDRLCAPLCAQPLYLQLWLWLLRFSCGCSRAADVRVRGGG
jgi:hypothetical protein